MRWTDLCDSSAAQTLRGYASPAVNTIAPAVRWLPQIFIADRFMRWRRRTRCSASADAACNPGERRDLQRRFVAEAGARLSLCGSVQPPKALCSWF